MLVRVEKRWKKPGEVDVCAGKIGINVIHRKTDYMCMNEREASGKELTGSRSRKGTYV